MDKYHGWMRCVLDTEISGLITCGGLSLAGGCHHVKYGWSSACVQISMIYILPSYVKYGRQGNSYL